MCQIRQASFPTQLLPLLLAMLIGGTVQPAAAAPDPNITALVSEVQASNTTPAFDCIEDYLAGLQPNEGSRRGYNSDGTAQDDLLAARAYIFNALTASLGSGNVSAQTFNSWGFEGVNIIGILPGTGPHYRRQFVISAHYDAAENPGADDNGSGVAGMLEAARVLGRYQFDATLVFAALDQEEERDNGWGQGSRFFASQARGSRARIRGALVLDMIGYNDNGDNWALVGRPDTARGTASAALSRTVVRALRNYTNLRISAYSGEDETDGYRFYTAGFPAVTVIEDVDDEGRPFNPYWHYPSDFLFNLAGDPQQVSGRIYIDFPYAQQIVRGVAAWAAVKAGLRGSR